MKLEQAKLLRMGAVAMCAFALAACGGGDDNNGGKAGGAAVGASGGTGGGTGGGGGTAPQATIVAGKVDAPFVPGSDARYASMGLGTLQGGLDGVLQESNGAYRTIGAYRVADVSRVGGMAGNTAFAMGSWAGSIVNATTGKEVTAPSGLSYVVFNRTETVASDGVLACTPYLTSPRIATGNGETLGGNATMTIAGGVVSVSADLKLKQANGNETALNFATTFTNGIRSTSYMGLLGATSRELEYSISVGAGSNDSHIVVVPWKLNLATGAQYGAAVLDCKRPS